MTGQNQIFCILHFFHFHSIYRCVLQKIKPMVIPPEYFLQTKKCHIEGFGLLKDALSFHLTFDEKTFCNTIVAMIITIHWVCYKYKKYDDES